MGDLGPDVKDAVATPSFVTVRSLSGEVASIAVATDETVDDLRAKVAKIWHRSTGQVRLTVGTLVPPGGQRVLDAGTTFTGVVQAECVTCRSRLDLRSHQPRTGSEEEEQAFGEILLCLSSPRDLGKKGVRWLWEAGCGTSAHHSVEHPLENADDECCTEDLLGEEDYDSDSFENEDDECCKEDALGEEDYDSDSYGDSKSNGDATSPRGKKARHEQKDVDCSYRRSGRTVRSARCSACLAATTSLCLQNLEGMGGKTFFSGIDAAFPKLKRLLISEICDGPSGVPHLAPIPRLTSLRMLDLWLPAATNGDPGQIQALRSLTNLTHLYVLGLRYIAVEELNELLTPLLKLEVLYFNGMVEIVSTLDLASHASLRSLCLEDAEWFVSRHSRPALALPDQLRDVAIPHDFAQGKAIKKLRCHYKGKGVDIARRRQPWAEKKYQAWIAGSFRE